MYALACSLAGLGKHSVCHFWCFGDLGGTPRERQVRVCMQRERGNNKKTIKRRCVLLETLQTEEMLNELDVLGEIGPQRTKHLTRLILPLFWLKNIKQRNVKCV